MVFGFTAVVPLGGLTGWNVLKNTQTRQQDVLSNSPLVKGDIEYFQENINKITSAEELVDDYRLLKVVTNAFGLGDELYKKAFIQKALEGGTEETDSFANRLPDYRWREMVEAIGFGNTGGSKINDPGFIEDISTRYIDQQFQQAVGEQNDTMRVGLYFEQRFAQLASREDVDQFGWFNVMGEPPLRQVFETVLGLPASTSQLDIDKQKEIFEDRASRVLGSENISELGTSEKIGEIIDKFIVRSQINEALGGGFTSARTIASQNALQLLSTSLFSLRAG